MNESEEFLTRWSRRKREAADEMKLADRKESKLDLVTSERNEISSNRRSAVSVDIKDTKGKEEEAAFSVFDPQSLPSIDSIVADTDIRGFLAPGVPEDLKYAALQQMWRADPAIRDFIGLCENSWDFNAPGGPHGFESLEVTEQMKAAVEAMFDQKLSTSEDSSAKEKAAASASTDEPVGIAEDEVTETAEPKTAHVTNDQLSESTPLPVEEEGRIAALQQDIDAEKPKPFNLRRGHGSALPK
jgi:hypothetical protein